LDRREEKGLELRIPSDSRIRTLISKEKREEEKSLRREWFGDSLVMVIELLYVRNQSIFSQERWVRELPTVGDF
jgi:hypothetical protein